MFRTKGARAGEGVVGAFAVSFCPLDPAAVCQLADSTENIPICPASHRFTIPRRGWDDETVLRTLEIVYRISCRRAARHLAVATLTSRKGGKAQSWKCWKFEPFVLPLRL
ncbi:MAG: hypothetical protein ACKO2L_00535, partial [Planctomycetaceae bacterium]